MRKCVVLVDNSNLFIGGRQLSAERKGMQRKGDLPPIDPDWRMDYDHLLARLADDRPVHTALMVGSQREHQEGPWNAARHSGWEVVVHERSDNGEKCVDTELVARGAEIIGMADQPMVLVIGSGDRDFVPLVDVAHRHEWEVEMCAFSNSFDSEGELAKTVDRVRPLDDFLGEIGFRHSHHGEEGESPPIRAGSRMDANRRR